MSISDKAIELKHIIALVCDVVPSLVTIVKEIIIAIRELKTI